MNELRLASRHQWLRLVQQWQDQRRLRFACWLIMALLGAHGVALCSDWRQSQRLGYQSAETNLGKMKALASQSYWLDRAVQAEDLLAKLNAQLWQAPNASLARADVQAWLDVQVKQAGIPEPRINVLPPLEFSAEGQDARIEVQLRGGFEPSSYGRLLQALESTSQWVSIDAAEVSNGVTPAINLQLAFHFRSGTQSLP
ncbi:hypothetical protein NK553_12490 [Pseudomonas sp. ZM23]|uniref:Uncharacterized protein n=1 Tax=Pseudomonas triclosanedens TaxID=2961893 RepID=A0ABY7A5I5_9PSED|nr:hypothetical protein [Pseudomonas triclosanedens]MCP8464767.1 hypothetical protein [Pseudomonas triclosanedens]MCP8470520.1 hypothetical protein [Pseudomonas triclosanedens]MCP8476326.1 hypothetical protein [Pseudomonas triclosanedens]WAI51445.1 hypothetical protein OU419_09410 [Pseudomonas triclosanedens]